MSIDHDALASSLDRLAVEIEQRSHVIGQQINVSAGPGQSGTIIGQRIAVTAGQGSQGTLIGSQITVSAGNRDPADRDVAGRLRQMAADTRAGVVNWSGVQALLDVAGRLASGTITAVSRGVIMGLLDK